jgi:hypothetical protein
MNNLLESGGASVTMVVSNGLVNGAVPLKSSTFSQYCDLTEWTNRHDSSSWTKRLWLLNGGGSLREEC